MSSFLTKRTDSSSAIPFDQLYANSNAIASPQQIRFVGRPSAQSGFLARILAYDCFPDFSAKVRRFIYHPLGILTLASLSALLCGIFLHTHGLVLFTAILVVLLLGLAWPWFNLLGLQGIVEFDRDRIEEGEEVDVRLRLVNSKPWAAWGLSVRGNLGLGAVGDAPIAGLTTAPARKHLSCRWQLRPRLRGHYPDPVLYLTTSFPFGLWERQRSLIARNRLIVWPKTYPVGPVPPVSGERQVEGCVSHAKVGSNGDVIGVRPYRRGDSPRRIHWVQSARHDKLIVCELESNSRPVIQLVLDVDDTIHTGAGLLGTWEWAVRVAASFAKGWLEVGAQVGLAWADGEIPCASGTKQMRKMLDQLAMMQTSKGKPVSKVLACPQCSRFRDGLQIIITTDLSNPGHHCHGCVSESQRWVILESSRFTGICATGLKKEKRISRPWLVLDGAAETAEKLRGGWREARHGS